MVNGVADYALCIARKLRDDHGMASTFLVCNPQWTGPDAIEGFPLVPLRSRESGDLSDWLARRDREGHGASPVILQLSGYGYDLTGAPFWLEAGLREWKRQSREPPRLLTYFHELYATGMPWQRAFWYSRSQQRCGRAVSCLSDGLVTSLERYARKLADWTADGGHPIVTLPVVSNVGEPTSHPDPSERAARMVVWGSDVAKRGIYGRFLPLVEHAVRQFGVTSIVDLGEPSASTPNAVAGVDVRAEGVAAATAVSSILLGSRLGVFAYNPNLLGKSGIFAACCAHGLPAWVLALDELERAGADGLADGRNYLLASTRIEPDPAGRLRKVGRAALDWYAPHDSRAHARAFAAQAASGGTAAGR